MIFATTLSTKKILKILSLNSSRKTSRAALIGSKAHSLLKLYELGYSIPDSICLDGTFFYHFSKKQQLPDELFEQIARFNLGRKLAIRSSSNIEDSPTESYAGSFQTRLNVPNQPNEIKKAIDDCYDSFRAQQNYLSGGISNGQNNNIFMGILVQPMIDAYISGVIFTSSPISPNQNSYRIEYCTGNGDRLTGGLLTGHAITLDKKTGKILQQESNMLLSRPLIQQLWQISINLEKRFNFPQDVEFVVSKDDEEIYLLQTRPITAFTYRPEYIIQNEHYYIQNLFRQHQREYGEFPVLSSNNILELFQTAIPLGYSIFKYIFAGTRFLHGAISRGRKELGYALIRRSEQSQFFISVGNQPRVNCTIDALTFRLMGIKRKIYIKKLIHGYLQEMRYDPEKAIYPEFEIYTQNPDLKMCQNTWGAEGVKYHQIYKNFLSRLEKEKVPAILDTIIEKLDANENFYQSELNTDFMSMGRFKLVKRLIKYIEYLRTDLGVEYVKVARIAFLGSYLIKQKLNYLVQKYPESLLNCHETRSSRRCSNFINQFMDLLFSYEKCPDQYKIPNQLQAEQDVIIGKMSISQFLKIFGHIGPLDISQPRLIEEPAEIIKSLFDIQKNRTFPLYDVRHAEVEDFYAQFHQLEPESYQEFKKWIRFTCIFLNLREKLKFELLKIIYLVKKAVLAMKKHLKLNGLIYYLEIDELLSYSLNPGKYRIRAMQRKAYFDASNSIEIKKVIIDASQQNLTRRTITPLMNFTDSKYRFTEGNSIHYGEAEGICLVARNNQEYYEKLIDYRKKGITHIIGFFKGLELSYANLPSLKGIVTENGGYLAHAGTIAREHNIPYISDVDIEQFKDGYHVILDTSNHKVIYREGEI
ncbi:hypothetical protein JW964_02380 [candidate division KSB1 bacterium]|nr:hypothetical protein [candidate division KSB1 bacterium]